jgi:hypothetical protein
MGETAVSSAEKPFIKLISAYENYTGSRASVSLNSLGEG